MLHKRCRISAVGIGNHDPPPVVGHRCSPKRRLGRDAVVTLEAARDIELGERDCLVVLTLLLRSIPGKLQRKRHGESTTLMEQPPSQKK